jgi:hypothetical protein
MTLLWIICVDTDITGQLLIIYCAFIKMRMGFQIKASDSVQWGFSVIL